MSTSMTALCCLFVANFPCELHFQLIRSRHRLRLIIFPFASQLFLFYLTTSIHYLLPSMQGIAACETLPVLQALRIAKLVHVVSCDDLI